MAGSVLVLDQDGLRSRTDKSNTLDLEGQMFRLATTNTLHHFFLDE